MHSEPITDVNEYMRIRYSEKAGRWDDCIHTKALCQDGYSVSIQASSFHYCVPRVTGARHYDALELGFPSERDPLIEGYREDDIYLFVPFDLVNRLLEKHGGIVYWE